MTIFEFVEQLCDIIGGEDAYYRFEKDELIDMCKAMSESHRKAEEEIAGGSMNQEQFVIEVQKVAMQSNPDLVNSTSYEDVLKELTELKDKAMRWEIIVSSFKPEPELFPVRQTLADARARQAEQRQGQL